MLESKSKTLILRSVPDSLRRALKVQAAREGKPMATIILTLIQNYLKEKEASHE